MLPGSLCSLNETVAWEHEEQCQARVVMWKAGGESEPVDKSEGKAHAPKRGQGR